MYSVIYCNRKNFEVFFGFVALERVFSSKNYVDLHEFYHFNTVV